MLDLPEPCAECGEPATEQVAAGRVNRRTTWTWMCEPHARDALYEKMWAQSE